MGRNEGIMLYNLITLTYLLICLQFLQTKCFEPIITEQEASTLRPSTLLVQIITEPESLIRIFEGLNLSFQMVRHWGRTGSALLRLPFNKDILTTDYDHVGLDFWRRPYYARMPTLYSAEAPRYIRLPQHRSDDDSVHIQMIEPYLWL